MAVGRHFSAFELFEIVLFISDRALHVKMPRKAGGNNKECCIQCSKYIFEPRVMILKNNIFIC